MAADGGMVRGVSTPSAVMPEVIEGKPRGWTLWDMMKGTLSNDATSKVLVSGNYVSYVDDTGKRTEPRKILKGGRALLLPTGHLLYSTGTKLMAVPFEQSKMIPTGEPVTLFDDVRSANYNVSQFTVSREGTLVYAPGRSQSVTSFVWVDRKGNEEPLGLREAEYGTYAVSPDGKRIAYRLEGEIWIWDCLRRSTERLSPRAAVGSPASSNWPRWTPDGKIVVYESVDATGDRHLVAAPVDRSAQPSELLAGRGLLYPVSFSRDGSVLVFFTRAEETSFDIYQLRLVHAGASLAAAGKPELLLGGPLGQVFGFISPDEKWLLFACDQNGVETCVTTYPQPGRIKRLSDGLEAMWNRAVPREVVHMTGSAMYAMDLRRGPDDPGKPQKLFDGDYPNSDGFGYDMAPDGRFLMLKNKDILKQTTTLIVVTNFFDELRRRAPRPQ